LQFFIGESVEAPERRGVETGNAEGHGGFREFMFTAMGLVRERAQRLPFLASQSEKKRHVAS
jgi:hypothetical protein